MTQLTWQFPALYYWYCYYCYYWDDHCTHRAISIWITSDIFELMYLIYSFLVQLINITQVSLIWLTFHQGGRLLIFYYCYYSVIGNTEGTFARLIWNGLTVVRLLTCFLQWIEVWNADKWSHWLLLSSMPWIMTALMTVILRWEILQVSGGGWFH